MRYDVCRKEIGKSNGDVEIFLLMLYHFFMFQFSKENVNWFKLWGCKLYCKQISRIFSDILNPSVYFMNHSKINEDSVLLYIQLLQVYEWVLKRVCQLILLQRLGQGGKQTRREAWAIRRNKLVLFTVQLQQRVNIKHSSSKSWRMVHSSDGLNYSN